MRMGPTDAECTVLCVNVHDARYVLSDGRHVYALGDQRTPEKFAGQRVTVRGTLDAATATIKVDSIVRARTTSPASTRPALPAGSTSR